MGTTYYAIGDVHGMDDMLGALHALVLADIEERGEPARIIHCGDYVDRGPSSWQVVERLMALEQNGGVTCLLGNHEAMMVHACRHRRLHDIMDWEGNGGSQTVDSYGGRYDDIPEAHLAWMESLPITYVDKEQRIVFVHAGLEPDDFPQISREIALWTRSRRFFQVSRWRGTPLANWMVVHGHTPTLGADEAASDGPRINVDTGACFKHQNARLTCARITPAREVTYITVDADLKSHRSEPQRPQIAHRTAVPAGAIRRWGTVERQRRAKAAA